MSNLSTAALPHDEIGPGTWPRGVDRTPKYSIGVLVGLLKEEFPATTVSKIRFLEDQGLVKPFRTGSGYRKYSPADLERIRFILAQQRDSYAPLKIIHEQLEALDGGYDIGPEPAARLVSSEGEVVVPQGQSVTLRTLREVTGAPSDIIEECVRVGLIHPDLGGRFPARAVKVVTLVQKLGESGVQARSLRGVRVSADRCADLVERVITSRENRSRPGDRERNRSQAEQLSENISDLHNEIFVLAVAALLEQG